MYFPLPANYLITVRVFVVKNKHVIFALIQKAWQPLTSSQTLKIASFIHKFQQRGKN